LKKFRIELLQEDARQTQSILETYQNLLAHKISPQELISNLKAKNQLGVTQGTLTVLG
jgi:U32 family peptidase